MRVDYRLVSPRRSDGLSRFDPMIAWMQPDEVALAGAELRDDLKWAAGLSLWVALATGVYGMLVWNEVLLFSSFGLVSLASNYLFWFEIRTVILSRHDVLVTDRRVIISRPMGPHYLDYSDIERVEMVSTMLGRTLGYSNIVVRTRTESVRLGAVRKAVDLVRAIADAAMRNGSDGAAWSW